MKSSTQYERIARQTFRFDQQDVRRLVRETAERSSLWCKRPEGCRELVDVEIDWDPNDSDEGVVVTVTRTFSQADTEPPSINAVDPVVRIVAS